MACVTAGLHKVSGRECPEMRIGRSGEVGFVCFFKGLTFVLSALESHCSV